MTTDSTIKTRAIPGKRTEANEIEYMRKVYLDAFDVYVKTRSLADWETACKAYREFKEVQKLYEEGHRILVYVRVIAKQLGISK